ncbi:alpha/beta fold hydrolase [Antribacter sp. KLBMP9083]|uniref:Alpha/beta fold hydrolase n=1 Tax=Antribacter soli TaxID=2910976 RepID=A0AA41QF02_9MICO|nr:alpha/beta fold hydrolase [Antribacter soli]MCF4121595.1 alpha/beta fold hydrolase [Antribacter soli]
MTDVARSSETRLPELPQLDGVRHHFVDLPGLRMHVAEAGSGEPVLLLHGFPQHWWEWRGVIPGLAEHYRVIVPDLRGAGWTEAPRGGYDREQLLADVVALLDAMHLDTVRLVAHDWAAIVGFQLCLSRPGRVRSFVSLAIPHPFISFHPKLLAGLRYAWYQLAISAPVIGARLLAGGRQRLPRYLFRRFASNQAAFTDADIELFLAPLRDRAHARAGSALYRDFITRELSGVLRGVYRTARLTTPTRSLVGADDPVITPEILGGHEGHADDLAVVIVDGASHFIPDERPDVVLQQALELFAD